MLSRSTPEAVQKICVSVKNAEESIKTLKDTLPGGVGGGKWGKVEGKAESQSYRRALKQPTKVQGPAHPATGTYRIRGATTLPQASAHRHTSGAHIGEVK